MRLEGHCVFRALSAKLNVDLRQELFPTEPIKRNKSWKSFIRATTDLMSRCTPSGKCYNLGSMSYRIQPTPLTIPFQITTFSIPTKFSWKGTTSIIWTPIKPASSNSSLRKMTSSVRIESGICLKNSEIACNKIANMYLNKFYMKMSKHCLGNSVKKRYELCFRHIINVFMIIYVQKRIVNNFTRENHCKWLY